jgi:hypothetical protein
MNARPNRKMTGLGLGHDPTAQVRLVCGLGVEEFFE